MARSNVQTKNGPMVSLYMVMIREYLTPFLSAKAEKEIKDAIKKIGGLVNQSGLFLSTTSREVIVNKKSGIYRRSVAFIPRCEVTKDLLNELDDCK